MRASDKPHIPNAAEAAVPERLDPIYRVLPASEQKLQLWAQAQLAIYDAENSQRQWSEEYFARWLSSSQNGALQSLPLIVLTRAEGGFKDGGSDVASAQMEQERQQGQAKLALLSTNSKQIKVHSGHNMELEAPDEIRAAIQEVVNSIRSHSRL